MDVQVLTTAAMALLSPYLAKAGEAFAKEAGEKLAEKAGALYQVVSVAALPILLIQGG